MSYTYSRTRQLLYQKPLRAKSERRGSKLVHVSKIEIHPSRDLHFCPAFRLFYVLFFSRMLTPQETRVFVCDHTVSGPEKYPRLLRLSQHKSYVFLE